MCMRRRTVWQSRMRRDSSRSSTAARDARNTAAAASITFGPRRPLRRAPRRYRGEVEFPTGHYHGITVTLDPALAPDCLSCILQDVDVRPSVLAEKFFADSECFVSRSSARVEHIFSELYAVPAGIRRGYFKVKVLELLLFLSALDVAHEKHGYTAAQVRLARAARDAACKHGGRRHDLGACTGTRCVALAARRELSRRVRHDARSVFARAEDAQCRAAPAHERPHGARYRGAVRL